MVDVVSEVAVSMCDNTGADQLMPYRLTEQFVISVDEDDKPSVRFYSLFCC